MKTNSRSVSRIAAPIKSLAQRFTYMALILAAVGLVVLGRVDLASIDKARDQATDAVTPILNVLSTPVDSVNRAVREFKNFVNVHDQNAQLREERDRLLQWQAAARRLEAENRVLRSLSNFVVQPNASFITARVIADTGGAFAHSLVLNAGERAGVRKGQAVVTGDGLVGRVAGAGRRSARILLISDLNSRSPVVIESSRLPAILAGKNAALLGLVHLPPGGVVGVGDRIVTSGHAGALPPGLPVGQVVAVSENGIDVQPYIDRDRLEYVRILDFGLNGVVEAPRRNSGGNGKGGDRQ